MIPVLVDNAAMPGAADLPEAIRDFAYINAAPIDVGRDFRQHMERLTRSIDGIVGTDKAAMEVVLARGYPDAAPKSQWSARRLAAVIGSVAVVLGGAIIAINLSSERQAQKQVAQQPQSPRDSAIGGYRPPQEATAPPPAAPVPPPQAAPPPGAGTGKPAVVARPKAVPPRRDLSRAAECLRRRAKPAPRPRRQISDRRRHSRRRDRHRARRLSRRRGQHAAVVPGDVARPVRLDLELLHRRRKDRRAAEGRLIPRCGSLLLNLPGI